MLQKNQINHLLLIFSTIGLTYFLYPPQSWTYIIILPFILIHNIFNIKIQLQLISILSLCASFFVIPFISQLFSVCALGLTLNIGYKINSKWRIWTLYFAQCLGITMRAWLNTFTLANKSKSQLSSDIILLFLTLSNLFMVKVSDGEKDRTLWLISPFFDRSWSYSLGMMLGIFLPFIKFKKYYRFFIVCLFLLIQIFLADQFYCQVLSFMRGLLIFDQVKHRCQLFFFIGYIIVDFFFNYLRFNYMLIGYIVMGIYIWQNQQKSVHQQQQMLNSLLQIQLEQKNSQKNN